MRKLVVLTGAGISAESGIPTFRASDGLWEGHDVMEVASPEGWARNPELVLNFYNERRKAAREAEPNDGHLYLKKLEELFDVTVVTQNVDNLHEKAGSSNVIHLHGSLFESRSEADESLVYPSEDVVELGDTCERGHQLRPNIVWFGEAVPMMEKAIEEASRADVFLVVGTSLQVYPAAGLVDYVPHDCEIYHVDPKSETNARVPSRVRMIREKASLGVKMVYQELS
ncbi:NAD-dependent protein deacylase [Fulvitalea axinellae]|uniref:NAD-dependent protein deacylase n=1 Tax=Fulvitalea axinellae TaxID=1182444 RepID=A0AAU9CDG3_9BACT|nr:NAD-dependent protein deacylase [Fulvitalea axinellae]